MRQSFQNEINNLQTWCEQNKRTDLLSEWDYEKNTDCSPCDVYYATSKEYSWICSLGHSFSQRVESRTLRGYNCPFCSGHRVLSGFNDFVHWCVTNNRNDLINEWDAEKNTEINPDMIHFRSKKKAWWRCGKCNTRWQASIVNRTARNTGCPICKKKKVHQDENDFQAWCEQNSRLDLLSEWDYEKNVIFQPKTIHYGSHNKVWWKCVYGHSWQTEVRIRVHGSSCPICSNTTRQENRVKNNLVEHRTLSLEEWCKQNNYMELLSEWDYDKNIGISPSEISFSSKKSVWWRCEQNHSWEMIVASRKAGQKCPYCSNRRVETGINDFKTWCERNDKLSLLEEWDYDKNADISPEMFSYGSKTKAWWKCKQCGYSWQQHIYSRASGIGCPNCASEQRSSFCEQALYFYVKQVFPDAISGITSVIGMELDIYIPSKSVAIEYDGEFWHGKARKLENDNKKNNLCSENGIVLIRVREPKLNEITNCIVFTRSDSTTSASLDDVILRVLDYLKPNNAIKVDTKSDATKILNQYALKKNDRSLSYRYPDIADEWHPTKNGSLTPDKISFGSCHKVWWLGKCGHEWQAIVSNRTRRGTGCPICSGNVVLSGFNDFATWCVSTGRSSLLEEWDYEKNLQVKPDSVARASHKKVWWKCSRGHSWQAEISSRTSLRRKGNGCPICTRKGSNLYG